MDRLDPFEVTMLRGAALALRRRPDRQSKIDEAGTCAEIAACSLGRARRSWQVAFPRSSALSPRTLNGRFSEMATISTQQLVPEQELIKRTISVEVGGVVHLGHR